MERSTIPYIHVGDLVRGGEYLGVGKRAASEFVVDAVGDGRRRDVHVDVVAAGAGVEVVAGRAAVRAQCAALGGVEGGGGDGGAA